MIQIRRISSAPPLLPLWLGAMTMTMMTSVLVLVAPQGSRAEIVADLVDELPGFSKAPFKAYSGYLTVPGPFKLSPGVAELRIHYQLHLSQKNPAEDPVVTWHQGGPGGSSWPLDRRAQG